MGDPQKSIPVYMLMGNYHFVAFPISRPYYPLLGLDRGSIPAFCLYNHFPGFPGLCEYELVPNKMFIVGALIKFELICCPEKPSSFFDLLSAFAEF